MDNHKVVIDLTSKKVDPPIKFVKARNSKPTSSNFKFSPKMFPQLKNSVKSVKWNSAEKKLEVTMEETPKFEVYKWIELTNQKIHDLNISPFVDLEMNSVAIIFNDANGTAVATVTLKTLQIEKHECELGNTPYVGSTGNYLIHKINFTYTSSEVVVHTDEPEDVLGIVNVKQSDEDDEWQTMEIQ